MRYNWIEILIKASYDVVAALLLICGIGAALNALELTSINLLIITGLGFGHYTLGALYSWLITKYRIDSSWIAIPWIVCVFGTTYLSIVLFLDFLNPLYQTIVFMVFSYLWTRANNYHVKGAFFPDAKRYILVLGFAITAMVFLPHVQSSTTGRLLLTLPYPAFILLTLLYLTHLNIYEIFMKNSINHVNKKRSIGQFKALSVVGSFGLIFLIECFIQFKRPFEMLMSLMLQVKSIFDYLILKIAFWAMSLVVWLYGDKREVPNYKPPKLLQGNLAEPRIADAKVLQQSEGSEFAAYMAIFLVLCLFAAVLFLLWRRQNGSVKTDEADDITEVKDFVFSLSSLTEGFSKGFMALFNRPKEDLSKLHPVRLKYRSWESYLKKSGIIRTNCQTPSQFAVSIGCQGKDYEDFQALTHLYETVRYAEADLTPSQEEKFEEIVTK